MFQYNGKTMLHICINFTMIKNIIAFTFIWRISNTNIAEIRNIYYVIKFNMDKKE
jgi:hypothetical protein